MSPAKPQPPKGERAPWWVLSTYFAEGFPYYLFRTAIPYFLKNAGHSNTTSGLAALAFAPWALKALWSPLVDLYANKKRWIVCTEYVVSGIFLLLALWMYINPELRLDGLLGISFWVLLVCGSMVAATQDIAVDAAYIENLTQKQQEWWAGVRTAAYRAAMIAGKSGILVIAGLYSRPLAVALAAVIFAGVATFHWLYLPDVSTREKEKKPSVAKEFKDAVSTFLLRDRAIWILLFAFFYKFGDALLFSMNNNFLDDLGVETIYVGILGSTDLLMAICGALCGGWLISKFRLSRCLFIFALMMNSADLIYSFYASLNLPLEAVKRTAFLVTGFEQFLGGLGTAAYMIAFIFFAKGRHSAAHYALLTSIMALEVLFAAPLGGFMADTLGWQRYFVFCFIMGIPGMVLVFMVLPVIRRMEREEEEQEQQQEALQHQ